MHFRSIIGNQLNSNLGYKGNRGGKKQKINQSDDLREKLRCIGFRYSI